MSVETEILIGKKIPAGLEGGKMFSEPIFIPELTLYLGKFEYGEIGMTFGGIFREEADFKVFTQNPGAELIESDAYGRPLMQATVSDVAAWYREKGVRMKNSYGRIMYQALREYLKQGLGDYAVIRYVF